jgi:RHS repeat-associated protein
MYWYGTGGAASIETDLSGNLLHQYVFFGGQRIARYDTSTSTQHYYFSDELGSHDMVTTPTGTCEQDIDFYPYGGQENDYCSTPLAQNYKFTGKERDSESGLDNFGARFYSSPFGRFMTPDWDLKPVNVPYAHFGNPQSLNLYSYVQNNPTTFGDPDGHCCWDEIVNWFSSSHSVSGSAGVDAGHSVDKAGGLSITSRAFAADASGSAAYGTSGLKVSGQAGVAVASEKATEGSIGTTSTKAVSADAEAHAGVSMTGVSAGAGANAETQMWSRPLKLSSSAR